MELCNLCPSRLSSPFAEQGHSISRISIVKVKPNVVTVFGGSKLVISTLSWLAVFTGGEVLISCIPRLKKGTLLENLLIFALPSFNYSNLKTFI